ncbi:hypothetical protein [Parasitella parasitica]|uniref:PSP1 C-terminal domain-containing protein n=1 Tax=Parasitella parasitica TaxID=35722 RepID=A0A0B7NII6_9FUNG|nr:hypothetical protein [Parasitella parasitica]
MDTFYNIAEQQQQQHQEENDDERWFLENNLLKQQNELYNIVPSNTTSNSTATTTTTSNDFNLDSYPWLVTPLSPPITKKDQTTATATSPVSYRPPSNPGVAWHSLWSSSTWHNDNSSTEPQKRSRSFSTMQLPSSFYNASTADDFFCRNGSSSSSTGSVNKSPLSSPLVPTSFMANYCDKSSPIWSFDYNSPLMGLEDRRHSIAVTQQYYTRPITPPPPQQRLKPKQQLQLQQQQQQQYPQVQQLIQQLQQQQIDEYFSPTTVAIDVQYLGKGVSIDHFEPNQKVYLVQFKGDYRFDWFYVKQDEKIRIQLNEMVIVEADRGYDLGKIIEISEKSSLEKGITFIKRIFRHANPAEIATHQLKQQDEQKALLICQAKIKQKNLNMEVVDAEYQWRKLTFYFKANERIDFRELVRELFKIYKTRIWMCACSSLQTMKQS